VKSTLPSAPSDAHAPVSTSSATTHEGLARRFQRSPLALHGIRFGVMLCVLGLALATAAIWLGGPALLVLWPATSVFVVGLGYLFFGPAVFGKRSDGSLSPLPLVLLFPYHVAAWIRLRWNARDGRPPFDLVAPGVYLGRRLVDASQLPKDARLVVDLTAEFRVTRGVDGRYEYLALPTLDTTVPSYDAFARLVEQAAAHAGPIYIHCAAGYGRSAAVAAAVLIARGLAKDVDEAQAQLRAARPKVWLHPGQRAHVTRFAEEHHGQG
jgi:protein-tyrosine phosphatase